MEGDLAGGIADISRAIALSPRYRDAYANRAVGYGMAGELERAIEDGRRVIALAPSHPGNYLFHGLMATSFRALKRDREALALLDEAIRLAPSGEPRRGAYFLERSRAWAAVGDRNRALEDAREARRLGAEADSAYWNEIGDGSR